MKFLGKALCLLCFLGGAAFCFSLDREAFSITNYDLRVQLDPTQHRLGVRGKITLRNDSEIAQKIAVLQISSSLSWRAIRTANQAVQYVTQTYTSDIDHTGSLSEAIVTLPQHVASKKTIDLDIAYEGVILLDATRLTRIGTPQDLAQDSDWDRIDADFTAVRGAGYVAWYPIASESANLSEGDSLFETLGRWKARETGSRMSVLFESTKDVAIFFGGNRDVATVPRKDGLVQIGSFSMLDPGVDVPTFALGDYKSLDVNGTSSIAYLLGKESAAQSYAQLLGTLDPLPEAHGPKGIQVVELPDPGTNSFASENLLLTPLKASMTDEDRLSLVYALARRKAVSPRLWISEGLAHLAQVIDIEHQHGRAAALQYLNAHQSVLVEIEKQTASPQNLKHGETPSSNRSLADMTDEVFMQSKALWVWSMLRDMVGDVGVNHILLSYSAPEDTRPSYMQELFTKYTQRDLTWFFDDWVYNDHGLPDFKVDSVFAEKTANLFLSTITVENLGAAGAEVPVILKYPGGEVTQRLVVRRNNKAVIRMETSAAPDEVVVNDGSVPESDMTNNSYKIETNAK